MAKAKGPQGCRHCRTVRLAPRKSHVRSKTPCFLVFKDDDTAFGFKPPLRQTYCKSTLVAPIAHASRVWAIRGRTAKWLAVYPDIAAQDNMRPLILQGVGDFKHVEQAEGVGHDQADEPSSFSLVRCYSSRNEGIAPKRSSFFTPYCSSHAGLGIKTTVYNAGLVDWKSVVFLAGSFAWSVRDC